MQSLSAHAQLGGPSSSPVEHYVNMSLNVSAPAAAFDHLDPLLLSAPTAAPPASLPTAASAGVSTTFPVLSDMSASVSSLGSSMRSRDFFASCTAIRTGTIDKCRLEGTSTKLKKSQWTTVYALLYSEHLLFYRDVKSAQVRDDRSSVGDSTVVVAASGSPLPAAS